MQKFKLTAQNRDVLGRKVKKLRADGLIPANIYGKKVKSQAIQVAGDEFDSIFKDAGETSIIELVVGKAKKPVLVSDIQVNPVTDELIHIDFRQVDLKEKITASVPIEIVGESPVEKSGEGTVVVQLDEVEVNALPGDLPEKFEVDISSLKSLDQAIKIGDLTYEKSKVELIAEKGQEIVRIQAVKEEEEAPVPTEGEEEAPVPTEGEEGAKEGGAEKEGQEKGEDKKEASTPEGDEKSTGESK